MFSLTPCKTNANKGSEKQKIKIKIGRKKIPEQMQAHCQCKYKQISFVVYISKSKIKSCSRLLFGLNMKIIYHSIKTYNMQTESEIHEKKSI